jgi:uncharacterized protein (TIGR02996 family)
VTTEDDFQNALDAQPKDWQTRLALADWLHERADPRAEGYRALGLLRRSPVIETLERVSPWFQSEGVTSPFSATSVLPRDWFNAIEYEGKANGYVPNHNQRREGTRRELEDAVALAFGKLPAQRQAEILAEGIAGAKPRSPRPVRRRDQ